MRNHGASLKKKRLNAIIKTTFKSLRKANLSGRFEKRRNANGIAPKTSKVRIRISMSAYLGCILGPKDAAMGLDRKSVV